MSAVASARLVFRASPTSQDASGRGRSALRRRASATRRGTGSTRWTDTPRPPTRAHTPPPRRRYRQPLLEPRECTAGSALAYEGLQGETDPVRDDPPPARGHRTRQWPNRIQVADHPRNSPHSGWRSTRAERITRSHLHRRVPGPRDRVCERRIRASENLIGGFSGGQVVTCCRSGLVVSKGSRSTHWKSEPVGPSADHGAARMK